MKNKRQKNVLIGIFIFGLGMDQITKLIAFKKNWIINNRNDYNNREYLIIISILVVLMILRYISNNNTFIKLDTRIILTLAISGITGNIIDRIWNIEPIVFISINKGINFNLAYIYILFAWVGMAFILAKNTSKMIREKRINNSNDNNCK